MTSLGRDSVFDPNEAARLTEEIQAIHMEKYGMTSPSSEPRHLSEASMSSEGSRGSINLVTQLEEERQVKAELATQLINANRTIQLLNAVVDAKDERIAELATERGQNRKELARSSSQVAALASELAGVQSELTLVNSKDSKGS